MNSDTLKLEITTPFRNILSRSVKSVTLPGIEGMMEILPGHAALISELDYGVISFIDGEEERKVAVHKGFFTATSEKVIVLADRGEEAGVIDIDRAKRAEEKARTRLEELKKESESEKLTNQLEAKLYRALTRQKTK